MPALTHGRVRNGFNSLPRRIIKIGEDKKCDGCTKSCPVTAPMCKIGKSGNNTSRVNHYSNSNTKRSNALGTVGRSGAARRAIMRRVTSNNCTGNNCRVNNKKDGEIIKAMCCNKEKCICK